MPRCSSAVDYHLPVRPEERHGRVSKARLRVNIMRAFDTAQEGLLSPNGCRGFEKWMLIVELASALFFCR
ncbi:hypothetical protein [Herbaspirillum seropedicae]|uniref:hypothetical protein n=1 Tax=Herbaspirillum seropedicae TaxID=964 RepID=UPI003FCCD313